MIRCPSWSSRSPWQPGSTATGWQGGTTFYFVTGGIHEAIDQARDAANGMDVRIGGGPNTIQQYLRTGLIDELHVAISPVLLGGGERLFEGFTIIPEHHGLDKGMAAAVWPKGRPGTVDRGCPP